MGGLPGRQEGVGLILVFFFVLRLHGRRPHPLLSRARLVLGVWLAVVNRYYWLFDYLLALNNGDGRPWSKHRRVIARAGEEGACGGV